MKKFEYKLIDVDLKFRMFDHDIFPDTLQSHLNELGTEGWELVGLLPFTGVAGRVAGTGIILKRELSN